MAKTLVEDREDNTRVPFLRGILIRSLQDSGLSFDTAQELATKIRDDLGDTPLITTHELHQAVLGLLKTRSERSVITRYEKQNRPFSRCHRLH